MVIEDRQSGLPGCWFQGPLEIGVSSGLRYLRSRLVEGAFTRFLS